MMHQDAVVRFVICDIIVIGKDVLMNRNFGYGQNTMGAANALPWTPHMAFGHCRAWVKVLFDAVGSQVGAPFEVTAFDCFQQS